VAVLHGRQTEGIVLAGIFFVSNANQADLSSDDGGEDFFPRQTAKAKSRLRVCGAGQRAAKREHPGILFHPDLAPAEVIAMLFAPAGVAASRLEVTLGIRTNPDVAPGGRNDERLIRFKTWASRTAAPGHFDTETLPDLSRRIPLLVRTYRRPTARADSTGSVRSSSSIVRERIMSG